MGQSSHNIRLTVAPSEDLYLMVRAGFVAQRVVAAALQKANGAP
jgi:hypothetical protein